MSAGYDFQNLSFDDFERLCADLMEVRLGVPLESFKVGRDGGIDLRHAPSKDRATVIQCKRYAPDAFNRLYSDLEKNELAKVRVLRPRRYVLCTSCKLSPAQKDKLLSLLAPYCVSSGDIFGSDELNRLIAEHAEIERRHFKLWLGSSAVLQRVIHAGIFAYSEHEIETLQREISRYVVHEGFDRALRLLDETHHCIIVGIPGVGKTTAARLLLAHYLREGYEVFSVTQDVEEAWKVLDRSAEAKQVIYYDDFLGQVTFSQKLAKNEDRRLLDLIALCKRSKNKRFILTTRDYILDHALGTHELLDRAKGDLKRSTVTLDDYRPIVRARLLANHLQFSNLGLDVLRAVVESRAYETIIEHPNFLPRVVEQLCSDGETGGRTPEEFIENAIAALNDPSRVWRRPFQQLTSDARHLAYALATFDGTCEEGRLETGWRALVAQLKKPSDRTFLEVMRELEGSFTHTQKFSAAGLPSKLEARLVRFVNPSVREFVMADLLAKDELLVAVFESAVSFNQLLFWRESSYSLSGRVASSVAAVYASVIGKKAAGLLSVGEPTLEAYSNKQTVYWNTRPQRLSRLQALFMAFSEMGQTGQARSVCFAVFGQDLAGFTKILPGEQFTWAAEVLKVLLEVHKAVDPVLVMKACESLEIVEWPRLAGDFVDVRNLWDAAQWAIEQSSEAAAWHDRMSSAFIERTRKICEELPWDLSSDEFVNARDELELLAMDFEIDLDEELKYLKEHADAARDEELENEPSSSLVGRYRQGRAIDPSADVEGVFRTLVEQLER